mmetsp:Transcript_318/g.561  ORF Transcript_318/g.561 Transcript_318/m.561 type:complete len:105 (-) Transcript_318:533-847(-)
MDNRMNTRHLYSYNTKSGFMWREKYISCLEARPKIQSDGSAVDSRTDIHSVENESQTKFVFVNSLLLRQGTCSTPTHEPQPHCTHKYEFLSTHSLPSVLLLISK